MKSDLVIAGLFAAKHRMSADRVDTRPLGRNALRKLVAASFERIRRLDLRGENPVIWFRRPGLIAGVKSLTDERQTPARYHITVEYAPFRVRAQDYHRAADNAKITRMLFGTKAYAVVVAYECDPALDGDIKKKIHPDVDGYIEADDPEGVYWHQLDPESE